jgi:hypothetical protein
MRPVSKAAAAGSTHHSGHRQLRVCREEPVTGPVIRAVIAGKLSDRRDGGSTRNTPPASSPNTLVM